MNSAKQALLDKISSMQDNIEVLLELNKQQALMWPAIKECMVFTEHMAKMEIYADSHPAALTMNLLVQNARRIAKHAALVLNENPPPK